MNSEAASPVGLAAAREGIAALRARIWPLVLLVAVGVVAGYFLSAPDQEHAYRLWLSTQALGSNRAVFETGISTPEGPLAADFLDDNVLAGVKRATGHSPDYLIEHLTLSQPPDGGPNPPVELIAEAGSETEAKALLMTWLASIHEVRLRHVRRVLARGERGLRRRLARATRRGEPATAAALADLLARIDTLRSTLTVDYAITRRPAPDVMSTPSRPRAAAVGAVGGLIAGIVLALGIALLDGRLRTRDGIEVASGLELLADLKSPNGIPTADHAKARLRTIGAGEMPSSLAIAPCGSVDVDEVLAKLRDALNGEIELKVIPAWGAGTLDQLGGVGVWIVVATPGGVRRTEFANLRAELGGIALAPAGLVIV